MPNESKKSYRVGVIGHTGRGNYGHGMDTAWLSNPRTEIVAVADAHESGLQAALKKLKVDTGYADYREMIEKEKLDIVAVCPRWIDQHHKMIMSALEHGCHVYTEKPFTRTLAEADDIVQACQMRHLRLTIAHIAHYSPVLPIVKKMLQDGAIGDVLEIRARGKEDRRGGSEDLWVLGSHSLELMQAIGGKVEWCFAEVRQDGHRVTKSDVKDGPEGIGPLTGDGVDAMYRFTNGITGYFNSHKDAGGRPSKFGLSIFGSKGVIEMQSGYLNPAFWLKSPSWSAARSEAEWIPITSNGPGKAETLKDFDYRGAHAVIVSDLLDAIENHREPLCNVEDARASIEMIAAVFESHRQNKPVSFPLENRDNPLTMLS